MIFVDTNYFLRFLLKDNYDQHLEAKNLFLQGAAGTIKLTTSIIVIFEIYWVFKSYYEKDKTEIIEILKNLLSMDFIQINDKKIFITCLDIFSNSNLSLEDCYNLSFAKKNKTEQFKTFDAKLAKEF
ncbi:MAG: hypothetical protein A2905_03450 [Candidatus Levybacteria bacterium RIFCSPLOWO2_01_FULL_36_10]|nr:MAG: hypothetical protein A2905_03450 [Candidatus Levybacteria bacterium RIFCSPLOWO2_01_FULL_36_10]